MFTRFHAGFRVLVLMLIAVVGTSSEATAQTTRQLVTQVVDERQTVELTGNIRPEASAENDRGRVDDTLVLDHMQLLLKRPAETEAALVRFIDLLHDPKSSYFHQWLTAEQFRVNFGPADADVSMVRNWLSRHGLTVNGVQASGMVIDFSGTAGQIRDAFKAEIHRLDVGGAAHIANMSNPRIPAALSELVNGIVSLNDFLPHANFKSRPEYTYIGGNSTYHAVAPADLATIYNLNPMFRSGISGQGQTIVVIENTNVFSPADWATFRSAFGLSGYTTLGDMDVNCSGTNNCYGPSGNYGVLSTSNSRYAKAYGAGAGWNFATGIGTVNVTNLVNAWPR